VAVFRCPNCGHEAETALDIIKFSTCESCGTTLFLGDDQVRLAGEQGVMHDVPLLFGLGDTIQLAGQVVRILGHARFSYGRGTWDEFWGVSETDGAFWVSVDEGDVVLQQNVDSAQFPTSPVWLSIGSVIKGRNNAYKVTELSDAECIAVRGSFDEELRVGDRYRFVNAMSDSGDLLSGEFWDGGSGWSLGEWVDPFDVVRLDVR
jgi:hypothetical protein